MSYIDKLHSKLFLVFRSNLTPLHVLVFTGTENISLARKEEKAEGNVGYSWNKQHGMKIFRCEPCCL